MSSEKQTQSVSAADEDQSLLRPCGVGEWDAVWLGRTDYLESGPERDWSFRDVEIVNGEVINVSTYPIVTV